MDSHKKNDLRVWWIPNVPGDTFYRYVATIKEAKQVISLLADYDNFQVDANIREDFSNAGGLEIFDGTTWEEWCNIEGIDINELMSEEAE